MKKGLIIGIIIGLVAGFILGYAYYGGGSSQTIEDCSDELARNDALDEVRLCLANELQDLQDDLNFCLNQYGTAGPLEGLVSCTETNIDSPNNRMNSCYQIMYDRGFWVE